LACCHAVRRLLMDWRVWSDTISRARLLEAHAGSRRRGDAAPNKGTTFPSELPLALGHALPRHNRSDTSLFDIQDFKHIKCGIRPAGDPTTAHQAAYCEDGASIPLQMGTLPDAPTTPRVRQSHRNAQYLLRGAKRCNSISCRQVRQRSARVCSSEAAQEARVTANAPTVAQGQCSIAPFRCIANGVELHPTRLCRVVTRRRADMGALG
jgi:hypothetical protein